MDDAMMRGGGIASGFACQGQDASMDVEVARILESRRDDIAPLVIDEFLRQHSDTNAAKLGREAQLNWVDEYLDRLAKALRGEPIKVANLNYPTGDMGVKASVFLMPIATVIESWVFFSQALAPFLWGAFSAGSRNAQAALEALERATLAIVRVNTEHFLDSMLVPGSLARMWSPQLAGEPPADATAAQGLPAQDAPAPPGAAELTQRERDIILLVVEGRSNGEIASELGLAQSTVKNAISRIFDKLNVNSRTKLARVAITSGLPQSDARGADSGQSSPLSGKPRQKEKSTSTYQGRNTRS